MYSLLTPRKTDGQSLAGRNTRTPASSKEAVVPDSGTETRSSKAATLTIPNPGRKIRGSQKEGYPPLGGQPFDRYFRSIRLLPTKEEKQVVHLPVCDRWTNPLTNYQQAPFYWPLVGGHSRSSVEENSSGQGVRVPMEYLGSSPSIRPSILFQASSLDERAAARRC